MGVVLGLPNVWGNLDMAMLGSSPWARRVFFCACAAVGMTMILSATAFAGQEGGSDSFGGPTFRKGMWRFVRTLELVVGEKIRRRLFEREMVRCVDPTQSMKLTFSSTKAGDCVSSKPEHADNRYTFANRCDYMGPVRTVITVQNEESYTELNELKVGGHPRNDLVVAQRIGDCHEEASANTPAQLESSAELIQTGSIHKAAPLIQN
jgi:hypothetical protein